MKIIATKWWAKLNAIFLYLLVVFAISWGVDTWRAQDIAGDGALALLATSVQGEKIDLMVMREDKPVLVYFWATWCGACRFVSPSVNFISGSHDVVSIALNSGSNKRLDQYLAAKDYHFTVVNDPEGKISRDWGVSVTPTILVINKGKITSVTTGFTSPIGIWARLWLATDTVSKAPT